MLCKNTEKGEIDSIFPFSSVLFHLLPFSHALHPARIAKTHRQDKEYIIYITNRWRVDVESMNLRASGVIVALEANTAGVFWMRGSISLLLIIIARASSFSMPAMASVGNANEAGIPHGLRTKYQEVLRKEHLNVYLVRHGESTNNVLAKRVETAYADGTMSLEAAREEWFAQRSDDPDLTPKGEIQAELLAQVLAPELKQGGNRAVLVASPMTRALRTAQPLAKALGQGVLVHPLMFENGGCYGLAEGGEFVPGKGRTAEEIRDEFGSVYDTSMLPAEGSWNGDKGREDLSEATARAHIAASWTMSKHALELSAGKEGEKRAAIVIVCHADFIDTYLGQLLAVNAARQSGQEGTMEQKPPAIRVSTENTSVSHISIPIEAGGPILFSYLNRMPHSSLLGDDHASSGIASRL